MKDQVGESIRTVAGDELIISLVNGLVAVSVPGGRSVSLGSGASGRLVEEILRCVRDIPLLVRSNPATSGDGSTRFGTSSM